jgi:hypothetical protein
MGLKQLLRDVFGGIGELAQPELVRKVSEGVVRLARHGDHGVPVLPREVEVRIEAGDGGLDVVERFVRQPSFDVEVGARVLNELPRLQREDLPLRRYSVEAGRRGAVVVREAAARRYALRIEGGDRDGARLVLPAGRRDFLLGRGEWHGDEPGIVNDVVLSEGQKAVSRRAARLHRAGSGLELEALDQQEALVVVRSDGERVRPLLSVDGRVVVGPGDTIEFTDGRAPVLRLRVEEE